MKIHLVSGGCGFVGRNMVKRLYKTTNDHILFIDNLMVGTHPSTWLSVPKTGDNKDLEIFGEDGRLLFLKGDFRKVLNKLGDDARFFQNTYSLDFERFADVFHFAAIVGGRAMIDGDPMMVALDLAIDAEFFHWITRTILSVLCTRAVVQPTLSTYKPKAAQLPCVRVILISNAWANQI